RGDAIDGRAAFRLIELVGRINFATRLDDGWLVELKSGNSRIVAHFGPSSDFDTVVPNNSLVRIRGVFEPTYSFDPEAPSGTVWVNDNDGLTWLETEENWSAVDSLRREDLTAANPELTVGRIIHAQGRIVAK